MLFWWWYRTPTQHGAFADGRGDVRKLAAWYFAALERGDLAQLDALFTHRVPFEEIARGFELIEHEPEDVVKVLVTYD